MEAETLCTDAGADPTTCCDFAEPYPVASWNGDDAQGLIKGAFADKDAATAAYAACPALLVDQIGSFSEADPGSFWPICGSVNMDTRNGRMFRMADTCVGSGSSDAEFLADFSGECSWGEDEGHVETGVTAWPPAPAPAPAPGPDPDPGSAVDVNLAESYLAGLGDADVWADGQLTAEELVADPQAADLLAALRANIAENLVESPWVDLPADGLLQLETATTQSGTVTDADGNSWTTYTLRLLPDSDPSGFRGYNVHSIFGQAGDSLVLPAAYQVATAEGGVDVGGISTMLVDQIPALGQDSWLSLGSTDGSAALSVTGIDFTAWTAADALTSENGLIAFLDDTGESTTPADGPTSASVIVGQMTVLTPADCASAQVATMNFQGHSQDRSDGVEVLDRIADWQATGVSFSLC
jgi:hypothetical protein